MNANDRNSISVNLVAFGKCMLELIPESDDTKKKSYDGDSYNALVYANRCFPTIEASFFSGVGSDAMSADMLTRWQKEGINTDLALISEQDSIGIYSISVDDHGERSFSYWRKESAATKLMQSKSESELLSRLSDANLVFFSGISLGILNDEDKNALFSLVAKLRDLGKRIAFDPNYRPAMFKDVHHAQNWITKAYQHADIALPGLDEHNQIFEHETVDDVIDFCVKAGVKEIIVKGGNLGMYAVYVNGESDSYFSSYLPFIPAPKQLDSTAAGDSFAGVYLASRLSGVDVEKAMLNASTVAAQVVQYPGAILPNAVFANGLLEKLTR